jgi:sulfatase maturation enzyme AslB (radical SAM superfamily)
MIRLDQALVQGIQDERCGQCWVDEKLGYPSLRQFANEKYANEVDTDNTDTWHLEIRLGNFCNLRCMMCSPTSSSSIETEYQEHRDAFNKIGIFYGLKKPIGKWWNTEQFMEFLDKSLGQVRYLQFTGGEPFMVPTLTDILEKVRRPELTDLLFVTNMTKFNSRVIELTRRFRQVGMSTSLEGIGAKNTYVRYPSDFPTIEGNIEKIKQIVGRNFTWGINHTFQHVSIYSLPELLTWARDRDLPIHFSTFYGQPYLDINSVPPQDIERFLEWMERTEFTDPSMQEYLRNKLAEYEFDPKLYQQFREHVKTLDSIRGTDYDAVFQPSEVT